MLIAMVNSQDSAAACGRVDVLKRLILDGRIDFRDTDETGHMLLIVAKSSWNEETVSCLLSLSCIDPNAAGRNGTSTLHDATFYEIEMVNLLLSDPRIDVKPYDNEGKQPLH
jgi:ankyrin repeat protein